MHLKHFSRLEPNLWVNSPLRVGCLSKKSCLDSPKKAGNGPSPGLRGTQLGEGMVQTYFFGQTLNIDFMKAFFM